MNPAIAGALGGAAIAAYVPRLRRQIRDGAIQVGHVGVRPLFVSRIEHPVAFRIASCALAIFASLLFGACAMLVARGFLQ